MRTSRRMMVIVTASIAVAFVALPLSAGAAQMAWSPRDGSLVSVGTTRSIGPVIATWYGPGFFGQRTGCGSMFMSGTYGVAHRTLPCGTMLLIGYRGHSVLVPVVDRGPYSGAGLDLSQATADHLGMRRLGRASVTVSIVGRGHRTTPEQVIKVRK